MRRLYRAGQLEFVMGGWVSNDEATVTLAASVQQMTEGHRWLQENIAPDVVPRVAWQIDPFGLSAAMAYIFAEMGLDAEVAWRVSEDETRARLGRKESELVWEGSSEAGPASQRVVKLSTGHKVRHGGPPVTLTLWTTQTITLRTTRTVTG